MSQTRFTAALLVFGCALCPCFALADEQRDFFESKIRPILVEHCYECHSTAADEVGGKLLVDSRDGMIHGGESGPVVIAGRPDASLIVQALRYDGLEMPPDSPLPDNVVSDFEKWILLGATDPRPKGSPRLAKTNDEESLWSFAPRNVPEVPAVKNELWPNDPIDHFVLSRLEQSDLAPTLDANPRTLVRRLYFDLIGLPPTREQVEQFIQKYAQDRESAIESLVDRLLASPQYGVRWGRHWLDVARYGESNGDDGLGRNATFPHAWRYRDYVVNAFNKDIRYDKFLMEQIAGDLLPAENAEQRNRQLTATGFLAIGSKPASAMNTDFAMDIVDDQINVVCTGVIGLSVACARCHDHKHDPIPTRDYYALAGIFASTDTLYGAAANEKLTAPPTPLHELKSTWSNDEVIPDRSSPPKFPDTYAQVIEAIQPTLHARLDKVPDGLTVKPQANYSIDEYAAVKDLAINGDLPTAAASYSVSFWFRNVLKNDARPITAYIFSRARLGDKQLSGEHLGIGGKHDSARTGKLFVFNGNTSKQSVAGTTVIAPNSWNHVVMVRDEQQVKVFLNGQLEIDGELPSTHGGATEFCLASRSDNFAPLEGNLAEFALYPRAITDDEALRLHSASGQPRGLPPSRVVGYAMGVREKAKPADCKIHINGQGKKLGPQVPRGVLATYRSGGKDDSVDDKLAIGEQESGRMALAQWLTRAEHPQTARVIVNRIWHHLFGKGIVATPDDFGVYGARPTHPELLDHLANRFVSEGWSIKRLIRAIVLSRTYQLDSQCDSDLLHIDPNNELLGRHSRRRLDAESLRDSMLRASGLIDYSQEQGSAIETLDALINWPPGEATDLHRESNHRSIYLCMLRHAPPKELAAFDLPDAVGVAGDRESTTLPTQTLFLINSEFVVAQSRALAQRIQDQQLDCDSARVESMFSAALHRGPTDSELERSIEYIQRTDDALVAVVADPSHRCFQAWASLGQALMTTSEFRYVD